MCSERDAIRHLRSRHPRQNPLEAERHGQAPQLTQSIFRRASMVSLIVHVPEGSTVEVGAVGCSNPSKPGPEVSAVQQCSHLRAEFIERVGLADQVHSRVEPAVMHDGVTRVAGRK
jgi:hypothetical protein